MAPGAQKKAARISLRAAGGRTTSLTPVYEIGKAGPVAYLGDDDGIEVFDDEGVSDEVFKEYRDRIVAEMKAAKRKRRGTNGMGAR